jgi:hypothetical protein
VLKLKVLSFIVLLLTVLLSACGTPRGLTDLDQGDVLAREVALIRYDKVQMPVRLQHLRLLNGTANFLQEHYPNLVIDDHYAFVIVKEDRAIVLVHPIIDKNYDYGPPPVLDSRPGSFLTLEFSTDTGDILSCLNTAPEPPVPCY